MNFLVVIILWFVPSISMAQIPPPPAAPSFKTEWLDKHEGSFALLVVGDDMAMSGTLILKVRGTAFSITSTLVVAITVDRKEDGIRTTYFGFLYPSSDVVRIKYMDIVPGDILTVYPIPRTYDNTWAELTLESGDTVRLDYFADPFSFRFQRFWGAPFDPRHPGLTISNRVAGTRERTGPGWGRPARKPVAEEMTWGRIKNMR